MAQQTMNGKTPAAIDFIGDIFENASSLPAELRKIANDLNQQLIDVAGSFDREKRQTAEQVEENLRQNELERLGGKAATWLSKPINLIGGFLAVVAFIILMKKL